LKNQLEINLSSNLKENCIIESYSFFCYVISIIKDVGKEEIEYNVQYDSVTYKHLKDFSRYENMVNLILKNYILAQNDFCKFDKLYKFLLKTSNDQLNLPQQILIPILFRILNLEKIGPLLIDEQIDEIYLDSSEKNLYIDHSQHGRCKTSILLSKKEIEAFVNRVALESDFSLTQSNPTMKSEFISSLFHTRVTVDISPITIEDIHIDIRKFHSNKLRMSDLITIGSLSQNQALFLIFLIRNQVSISIIGPPNSGKTTLQNALTEFIPSNFRLLSVEDVLETTNIRQGNTIRFRLGYDPYEGKIFSKSLEVQKILHRSPDFINLGELSIKSHFTAFLNVLSIGVPSIQTIHGKNSEFLFSRLRDIYHIPLELLKTSVPHIFIELDVFWIGNKKKRSVIRITELNDNGEIKPLSPEKIDSFLDEPGECSEIFTINYLTKRNRTIFENPVNNFEKITNKVYGNLLTDF
jgi:type IV secretory pathway ATPase VirB11/archaellum biosynthesis ATPase